LASVTKESAEWVNVHSALFYRLIKLIIFKTLFIERRVEGVEVPAVELVGHQAQILSEALVVHDLARSEETYRVDDVRIVAEAQDVIVCGSRFLFGSHRFMKVGDRVALAGDCHSAERHAGRRRRINTCGVVYEVGVEARLLDLILAEVARELIHDRADHFEMVEFLRADIGQSRFKLRQRHRESLRKIAYRSAEFAVGTSIFQKPIIFNYKK